MDRTGIIAVSLCAVLLVVWFYETQKQAQQLEAQRAQQQVLYAATNRVAATSATETAPVTASSGGSPVYAFDTNAPEQIVVLTNSHARYTFTSRGGGLKLVDLLDYPETISARWKTIKTPSTNNVASLNTYAPTPVLAILGDQSFIGDGNFTLTRTDDGVRAEKKFSDGLVLTKEFHLSSNYMVNASVNFRNTSSSTLTLPSQQWVVGTATPMDVDDSYFYTYGGAMWFDGSSSMPIRPSYFNPSTSFLMFFPRTPKTEYLGGSNNVVWAAAGNQFFVLLGMPQKPAEHVMALPVTLPQFSNIEMASNAPPPEGVLTALIYPAQTLTANSNIQRQIIIYAGPKEYWRIADIGQEFQNRADNVMGFGFFGICAKPLLIAMNWMHDVTHLGYGWVIVLFTVSIKVIFWPLTAASTRSMKRMQALAPELKALQAKYKDDMQKLTSKQWELYKKHKVSPMSGCLPMAIQMPVFIGFFTMIRSAIELRGAHFLWVADLSKPDTLFIIPGINFPFNLLPLLMGGAMLWQSHLQPPTPGMDQTQAKLMRYMPLIFLLFLYNYSAGLALYWTVNNLLTILQTKLTKNLRDPAAPGATPALTTGPKSRK